MSNLAMGRRPVDRSKAYGARTPGPAADAYPPSVSRNRTPGSIDRSNAYGGSLPMHRTPRSVDRSNAYSPARIPGSVDRSKSSL